MKLELISLRPPLARNAPPLLFVHGAFCGAWVWEEHFLPYFANHGYEAHALSLRGHGASAGHEHLHQTGLAEYVDDLARTFTQFENAPVLVGHSLGGVIVQRFLRTRRAPAAVLLASGPPHGMLPCTLGMALRDPWLLQQLWWFQSLGPKLSSPDILRRAIFSASLPRDQALHYFARMQSESVRVALELMWPDLPPTNQPSPTPLLVLGAEHDAFVSPAMVRATAAAYGTTARIIPKTAHAMMLEVEWRRSADEILQWLQLRESGAR